MIRAGLEPSRRRRRASSTTRATHASAETVAISAPRRTCDADGRGTVVPVHSGETIGPGLLAAILRDCEIERDEFIELL